MKMFTRERRRYLWPLLFMAAVVVLDQISKAHTVRNIELNSGFIPVIPKVVRLVYSQNTGAAFSMLAGKQWVFIAVFAVFLVLIGIMLYKKWLGKTFELWCLAAIVGGGIGNLIDRIRLGYVVDMIEPLFVNFAVFNVADSFITCGVIALAVYILFFADRKKKPEEPVKPDSVDAPAEEPEKADCAAPEEAEKNDTEL